MIDYKEIIKVPELDQLEQQIETDLKDNKSKITNFRNGGIFKTLIMIFLKAILKIYELMEEVVPQIFLSDAKGVWLDAKAPEYNCQRKLTQKTEGYITAKRNSTDDMPVMISEGLIIKTEMDSIGNELKYVVVEKIIMEKTQTTIKIPVKAEMPGAIYNVPAGTIKYPMQHVSGIDEFINEEGWITKEGTDEEDDDSLRERCENFWDELATNATTPAYEAAISKINGVLDVEVDDLHPRGQGTVDITVIGTAGMPTDALLNEARAVADKVKGPYDNVLVFGPQPVYQNVDVTLYIDRVYGDKEAAEIEAKNKILKLFTLSKGKSKNKLYKAVLTSALMEVKNATNAKVSTPTDDVFLEQKQIILPGNINIQVIKDD